MDRQKAVDKKAMKEHPDLQDRVNAAFRAKAHAVPAAPAAAQPAPPRRATPPKAPTPKSPPTIVPPSQPNVARADAKAALDVLKQWQDKIDGIKNQESFNQAADELEALPHTFDQNQFNAIQSALNHKGENLDDSPKIASRPFNAAEHDAPFNAHFDKGGKIIDAPNGDLYGYIEANPNRFKIKRQGQINGNASELDIVTDKKSGERVFLKHERFRMDYAKEHLAALVANQAGLADHKGRIIEGPNGPVFLVQDVQQGNNLGSGKMVYTIGKSPDEIAKGPVEKGLMAHDPQSIVNLALYDFLVDNKGDRHQANMHFWQDGDSLKPLYLDQGLSFGHFSPKPDQSDIDASFQRWWRGYKANSWGMSDVIGKVVQSRAHLEQMIGEAAKKMDLDLAKLKQAYLDGSGDDPRAPGSC